MERVVLLSITWRGAAAGGCLHAQKPRQQGGRTLVVSKKSELRGLFDTGLEGLCLVDEP